MTVIEHTPFSRACNIAQQTAGRVLDAAVAAFKTAPNSDTRYAVDHALRACIAADDLRRVTAEAFMAEVEIFDRLVAHAARLVAEVAK